MGKEKECCDVKVTKTKEGFRVDVKGVEVEKCMEECIKKCDCC